ncbi:DUF1801 domain-containing protein [Maribacter sp. 2210JD10-5]|uniref:DUF1801 domain-containing protein n=1 Tax=Maribacter sp. 2210JD10-5 TaxID=3386272 RepID=UPI0039BD4DC8
MKPAEEYILKQPEPFRDILMHVKTVIEAVIPEVVLKYKWNIPCFYCDTSPICYLNVSVKKGYVDMGFWNSAHLTKHLDKMVSEKRKVVRSLRYCSLEEIDDEILIEILRDAYAVRKKGFYKKGDIN